MMSSWSFSFADSFDSVQVVSDYSNVPSNIDTSISYTPNSSWIYYPCSISNSVYLFGYMYNGSYHTGFASNTSTSANLIGVRTSDNYTYFVKGTSGVSLDQYNDTYDLYYNLSNSIGTMNTSNLNNINLYDSLDSALESVKSFIDSSNVLPDRYPFTLQNGYLFVYDLGQSGSMYSFDLSSESMEYSNIGSNPFPDTNQSYWFSDSLPEIDSTQIPPTIYNLISWDKGDNGNIFGMTKNMSSTISGTSSGRFLYIYNPPVHYKWSGQSNPTASEVINYSVVINGVSDLDNWYIYDSVARLTDFNQGGKVVGTITGEQITGTVTSSGGISLSTSYGAIYVQNSGGSTDISGAHGGSLLENIEGLKQAFDDAINNIILLISTPVEYIQRLIGLGGEFVQSIASFFDFLPAPLDTMVITGISVVIVIGVLHTLL